MRDILTDLDRWFEENRSIALATVVQTWGSSPRRAGSKMALTADGKITGSVSGGCVEGAVIEAGIEAIKSHLPRLMHFSVDDESAWNVGLACGGSVDIFVQPLEIKLFQSLRSIIMEDRAAALVTVVRGASDILGREVIMKADGSSIGTLGNGWDERAGEPAREIMSRGISQLVPLNETTEIFIEAIQPQPTLIVVGGVHIAIALLSAAKNLGYRTVLIDPRKAWGTEERFPHVDQILRSWPEDAFGQISVTPSTAIVTLTHDPKIDDTALQIALRSPAFYVGALGSRSTQTKRRERLLKAGLTETLIDKLHAPIGIKIGAETPEEIALAIMAEVVEVHHQPLHQEALPGINT
jgi:xanthine dehydrogenase accessory factor